MRSLKYAILGLLCRKPLTGYDILVEFEKGLGNFWRAQHSQIYRELAILADEGDVAFSTVIQGERLEKKLYTITEQGRAAFQIWLRLDEPLEPTPKDVFKLRVYLSEGLENDELVRLLHGQLKKREKKVQGERTHLHALFGGKSPQEIDRIQLGDYFVLTGAIMREEAYVDWLHQCLALLQKRALDT